MRVRWSLTALIELEEILVYISDRHRRGAEAVVERLDRVTERLESFPFTGIEADEDGTYILPIVRYPYMLYLHGGGERGSNSNSAYPSHRTKKAGGG